MRAINASREPAPLHDASRAPSRQLSPPKEWYTVHVADSRRLDLLLGSYSSPRSPLLTATITSPPYGSLKDYGHPDQIGFGQRDDEYRIEMRRVLESAYRHTRADGSLWLVADTLRPRGKEDKPRRMQMLPFELAQEAESVGWILRDIIIWVKDKTLPWSARGRLRNQFEYVLFFVKSPDFKYHVDRLREPDELEQWWVRYPERYNPQGKSPTNIWAVPIPVQGSWSNTAIQHACPLPPDLVERMLLLSTDPGDVVLDPFAGSGVVIAEAERLDRRSVGFELVDRHVRAFQEAVRPEILERRGRDVLVDRLAERHALQETILNLRVVKYPKALMVAARNRDPSLPAPAYAVVLKRPVRQQKPDRHVLVSADVIVVLRDEDAQHCTLYLQRLQSASRRQPASKFGVSGGIRVITESEALDLGRGRRLYGYTGGRCHVTIGPVSPRAVATTPDAPNRHNIATILSNVSVTEKPRALRKRYGGSTLNSPAGEIEATPPKTVAKPSQ